MSALLAATPLIALDGVAFDLDTTSEDATTARITRIGLARIRKGKLVPEAHSLRLIAPGETPPPDVAEFTGLGRLKRDSFTSLDKLLAAFEAYVGDELLVGHNIAFDIFVLRSEYQRQNRHWPDLAAIDVRRLARLVAPALASDGLADYCKWLELPSSDLNSAGATAMATARIFESLVPRLREKEIRTIAEAAAACRDLMAQDFGETASGLVPSFGDAETHRIASIDSYPYSHRVSDVMAKPPLFIRGDATVQEALALILDKRTSSVFAKDGRGETGIVTERDLLKIINERGAGGLSATVQSIMSKPLATVDEDAFLYRAIARIEKLAIRHLAVTNAEGEVVGALTPRNLLHQRATAALILGEDIDTADGSAELGAAWSRLTRVSRSLNEEGSEPRLIASVISAELCAATRRAAELAEASMASDGWGTPPVPYAVLVMGSAGRGESLLAADQDNAIVFEKGEPGGSEDRWFEELGTRMSKTLDEAGIPLCKGGVMAKNAAWRHSVEGWRGVINGWIRRQRPEDLLNVDIFFDGVTVHGDRSLGDGVRNYALELGNKAPDFQALLTELARKWSAPFSIIGGFKTDETGRIDLKKFGLMPIFTVARVLAIRHAIRERSTPGRLLNVAARGIGSAQDIENVVEAHRILLGYVLAQQLADAEKGIALSPKIEIARLDGEQRGELKKAINQVRTAIDLVSEGRL